MKNDSQVVSYQPIVHIKFQWEMRIFWGKK